MAESTTTHAATPCPSASDSSSVQKKQRKVLLKDLCTYFAAISVISCWLNANQHLIPYKSLLVSQSERRTAVSVQSQHGLWNTSCIERRGWNGTWVLDWDYAANYSAYPVHSFKPSFRPTPEQPYRLATAWRWIENTGCGVIQLVDRDGLCRVTRQRKIRKIILVGDSTSGHHFTALSSLAGNSPRKGQHSTLVKCDKDANHTVPLHFLRINGDRADNPRMDATFSDILPNLVNTTEEDGINVIVVNIGAHVHSMEEYYEVSTRLFEHLVDYRRARPHDVLIYRSSVPGHAGCTPKEKPRYYNWTVPVNTTPFANYEEAFPTINSKVFDWDLIPQYNEHIKRQLASHEDLDMLYMNVYNSTVLRRDGHVGGGDCLHYFLPGPNDWWAHTLYTNLWELPEPNNRMQQLQQKA